MPFPGIVAHYLDQAQCQIAQAVRPELRPKEPPVNGIFDYVKSLFKMPVGFGPVSISVELAWADLSRQFRSSRSPWTT